MGGVDGLGDEARLLVDVEYAIEEADRRVGEGERDPPVSEHVFRDRARPPLVEMIAFVDKMRGRFGIELVCRVMRQGRLTAFLYPADMGLNHDHAWQMAFYEGFGELLEPVPVGASGERNRQRGTLQARFCFSMPRRHLKIYFNEIRVSPAGRGQGGEGCCTRGKWFSLLKKSRMRAHMYPAW